MAWYKITSGTKVYVVDPEHLQVFHDNGVQLTPTELLASWRRYGEVERLPEDVDPEQVMREALEARPPRDRWSQGSA